MATFVRQMLGPKTEIISVTPESTVFDAVKLMAEKNIGVVVVMSEGEMVGIFSERDYARKVRLQGKLSTETPVCDVMTDQVVSVNPDWTADQCMALMDQRHIRHLPVLEDGKLIGMISIRTVVRAVLAENQTIISHLEHYITTGY